MSRISHVLKLLVFRVFRSNSSWPNLRYSSCFVFHICFVTWFVSKTVVSDSKNERLMILLVQFHIILTYFSSTSVWNFELRPRWNGNLIDIETAWNKNVFPHSSISSYIFRFGSETLRESAVFTKYNFYWRKRGTRIILCVC